MTALLKYLNVFAQFLLAVFDAIFLHEFSCDTARKCVKFKQLFPKMSPYYSGINPYSALQWKLNLWDTHTHTHTHTYMHTHTHTYTHTYTCTHTHTHTHTKTCTHTNAHRQIHAQQHTHTYPYTLHTLTFHTLYYMKIKHLQPTVLLICKCSHSLLSRCSCEHLQLQERVKFVSTWIDWNLYLLGHKFCIERFHPKLVMVSWEKEPCIAYIDYFASH